jgi:cellulose synthase/poly-beta-1,6-N-acetylglucosamine synthase-like glycosyltransferase
MSNASCGIATVIIGREFSLTPLLSYFKNVEVPENIDVNLYIVLGCDADFEILVKDRIKELELSSKYRNISYIKGVSKCYSDLSWNEWETFTRQQDPEKKHRAALENIEIGLDAAKNETYVHFVDDDTIPPVNALRDLLKSYQSINNCGIASGIYFNKTWVEPTIAVRKAETSRRIVGSYKKETWKGCSIDD